MHKIWRLTLNSCALSLTQTRAHTFTSYTRAYIHMHTQTYTHLHTAIHMHIYINMHIHTHTQIYIHTHAYTHARAYKRTHTYIQLHAQPLKAISPDLTHAYPNTHTHTHRQKAISPDLSLRPFTCILVLSLPPFTRNQIPYYLPFAKELYFSFLFYPSAIHILIS